MAASYDFIKNFVKFAINTKRINLKKMINAKLNDLNNNESNKKSIKRDNFVNYNIGNDKINQTSPNFNNHIVLILHVQFLIECTFLSILDSEGKFF